MRNLKQKRVRKSRSFADLIGAPLPPYSEESSLSEHDANQVVEDMKPFQWSRIVKVCNGEYPRGNSFKGLEDLIMYEATMSDVEPRP